MQRPNDDLVSKDDVPWWLKYSARGVGAVGGASMYIRTYNKYEMTGRRRKRRLVFNLLCYDFSRPIFRRFPVLLKFTHTRSVRISRIRFIMVGTSLRDDVRDDYAHNCGWLK